MKNVLIFDTETSDLGHDVGKVIEVGAVLWSVEHRSIISCFSSILGGHENPCERFNGIPSALVATAPRTAGPWAQVAEMADASACILAHAAHFDQQFVMADPVGKQHLVQPNGKPSDTWVCTLEDVVWPNYSESRSLIALALAHGVAVTSAHRAIHDCLLLTRMLEAIPADVVRPMLEAAMVHALLPKGRVVAAVDYANNYLAKLAHFHWDATRRQWWRYMTLADAANLPFETYEQA